MTARNLVRSAFAVALVGCAAGFGYTTLISPPVLVVLEPASVTLAEDPIEGAEVKVNFMLRNTGRQQVSVLGGTSTCGCTSLITRGGAILSTPLLLAPGESLPWQATINTAGRTGAQTVGVMIKTRFGSRLTTSSARVTLNVRSAWRAVPPTLSFTDIDEGSQCSADVLIVDGMEGAGIEIKEVSSSAPEILRVETHRLDPEDGNSTAATNGFGEPFAARFRLTVHLTANGPSPLNEEHVVVRAADETIPDLHIPVVFRFRDPPFRLSPTKLVVQRTTEPDEIRRRVVCTFRSDVVADIRVAKCPKFADVQITELDKSTKAIDVKISPAHATDGAVVFMTESDASFAFELPIHVLPRIESESDESISDNASVPK